MDFIARHPSGDEELIQVCADLSSAETRTREVRALTEAANEHPRAVRRLLVLDRDARFGIVPAPRRDVACPFRPTSRLRARIMGPVLQGSRAK